MGEMQLSGAGSVPTIERMVPELEQGLIAAAEMAVMEMVRFDAGHPELKSLLILAEAAASCSLDGIASSTPKIALATLSPERSSAGTVIACAIAVVRACRGYPMLDADGLQDLNRTILGTPAAPAPLDIDALAAFIGRVDIPVVAHAALAHASLAAGQPFESGNGRTARVMNVAMFRVAGVTTSGPIPLSAGLAGNPRGYRSALRYFRGGDPTPVIELLTEAAFIALDNAVLLAEDVSLAEQEHEDLLGGMRSPAVRRIAGSLLAAPALTATAAMRMTGASESAVYRAMEQLSSAGILVPAGKAGGVAAWTAPRFVRALDGFMERALR